MNYEESKRKNDELGTILEAAVKEGRAELLTVDRAKQLKGKRIIYSYESYKDNEKRYEVMTVGDIITEFDRAKTQPYNDEFPTRADYWMSYMTEEQLERAKSKLLLLDETGNWSSYIFVPAEWWRWHDMPTFCCSDSDRFVYFIKDEDEDESEPRYKVEQSRERTDWWVVTDIQAMVVVRFKEHEFNATQEITPLEDIRFESAGEMASYYARVMREMADYLLNNHRGIAL